jgi:branched-chain amino acid transport system permease protein
MAAIIMLSGSVLGVTAAEIGFRALPVALLGGLESVRGAVIAGVIVGMAEALASTYLDPLTNGALSQIFPFILIILVLLIRPQGLFGWKILERI